jgi:hypothetical protein
MPATFPHTETLEELIERLTDEGLIGASAAGRILKRHASTITRWVLVGVRLSDGHAGRRPPQRRAFGAVGRLPVRWEDPDHEARIDPFPCGPADRGTAYADSDAGSQAPCRSRGGGGLG